MKICNSPEMQLKIVDLEREIASLKMDRDTMRSTIETLKKNSNVIDNNLENIIQAMREVTPPQYGNYDLSSVSTFLETLARKFDTIRMSLDSMQCNIDQVY